MSELTPRPEPTAQKPELRPGGVDAIPVDPDGAGLPHDPDPHQNPAAADIPDSVMDAVRENEASGQAPDGAADQEAGTLEEAPPSGQVAEDGSVEPPA